MSRRATVLWIALVSALLLLPASASARKVGNPGSVTATATNGTISVGDQTFDFDDPIVFSGGTIQSDGSVSFPPSDNYFPPIPLDAGSPVGTVTVRIRVPQAITGNVNPLTGAASLRLPVWIRIEGLGDCRIASASSPIVVNPLTTGTDGALSGTPYNPSNGTTKLVNSGFSVPGASDCTYSFLNVNGQVNDTVGIPTSDTEASFNIALNPVITKGINATFTATPSSGSAPLSVSFNPSGSTAVAGVRQCTVPLPTSPNCGYRWDFNGDGNDDQVTNSASNVTFPYTTPGTYQPRLRVYDTDQDFDQTTRTVTVNPPPPDLTINKSHTGNFLAGQQESYTLAVQNIGSGATQGTTTVTDTLPAGMTFVSGTGSGWSCSAVGQVVTCNRTSTINGGGTNAPNITLNVNVADNPASLTPTNTAAVSTAAGSSPELVLTNNSDSDPTTIDKIDMGITKTAVGTFETGTVESYNLALTNAGTIPTTGTTTVTDVLSSSLTFVGTSTTGGWNCGNAGQTVTCTRPAGIPVGAAGSIQIDVIAGPTAPPSVNNTATVSTPDDLTADNPLPNNDSSSITTPVTPTVDLTIDKTNGSAFRVGSSASYTIAVQNRGAKTTSGTTTVTDTLPAGLTPTGASGSGWTCNVSGQDVSCTNTTPLAANESAGLLTVNVNVTPSAARPTVNNTATVATSGAGPDADVNNGNNSDTVTTTITATDLTIDKSHVGGFPLGGQGTYTLSVRNDGNAPTVGTTTVTDTLPAELTYVNATGSGWSCGNVGQAVTCTRSLSIDGGQTAPPINLVVDVADTEEEETINSASVSTADDVNSANDSDTDPTPLTAADLEATKSHTGSFRVGTDRAYVIRVENVGSQPTQGNTVVTDTLPAGLTYTGASGSGWSCGAVGQLVTCTRTAAVAAGASTPPITVQVDVGQAAYPGITNVATVTNQEDRNDANDSASDPTTVTASDLALEKTHNGAVQAGDQAAYAIKVTNVGTADTTSTTTVTDTLPASLSFAGSPSQDWSCSASGQVVTCVYDESIEAGDPTGTTLELRVNVATSAPTQITNSATVALTGDPNGANNSDSDTADVGSIDLGIDKSHTGTFPRGGSGEYTITVDNDGTDPSEGITRVTDVLPAGLSYDGASGTGWSCSFSSGTVECDRPDPIPAGDEADPITLSVEVSPTVAPQVTNTASVAGADDVDSSDNSDSDPTDTTATSDVAATIKAQVPAPNGAFRAGTDGTYNVAVRNNGSAPLTGGVSASIDLPDGLSFEDFSGDGWSCIASAEGAACSRAGDLPPESRSDITLDVGVDEEAAPGVTTSVAVSNAADMSGPNNSDTDTTPVKLIDLSIAMQHAGTFALGAPSTYTINVESVGTHGTIAATRVFDELPAGLTPNSATGNGWSCTISGQAVLCARAAALAVGAQADPITITVTPQTSAASQNVTNSARVQTKDDLVTSNNLAIDQATVGPAPPAPEQQVQGQTCKKKKGKKGKKGKKKKCKKG